MVCGDRRRREAAPGGAEEEVLVLFQEEGSPEAAGGRGSKGALGEMRAQIQQATNFDSDIAMDSLSRRLRNVVDMKHDIIG